MKPVDQDIRDRVATRLDVSFALSASAGAGKTSVLVDRVLSLLRAGTAPQRIAVITFTEKAAGEVGERVQDRLEQFLAETEDPKERDRIEQALGSIADLTASTIHAFALDLLRREALAARWSPHTEILAETLSASSVDQAYEEWRRGFDRRHPEMAVDLRHAAAEKTIKDAAFECLCYRDLTPVVAPAEVDWAPARAELDTIRAALEEARACCTKPETCKLLANNGELLALLERGKSLDPEAAVRSVLETNGGSKSGGKNGDWRDDGLARFKKCIQDVRDWQGRTKPLLLAPLHRALILDQYEHFLPAVEASKRAGAQADYEDLLFRSAELLSSHDAARRRLAARFDAILVDEVQDTDPLQAEIAFLLTRAPELTGDWHTHPPRPGHLFAVGDAKQSIYRFRRADVTTWRQISDLIARDGEKETLRQNFRSVPGIVGFANHVFADFPDYEAMESFREPGAVDPVVVLSAEDGTDADAAARHIHSLLTSKAQVIDRHSREPRDLELRDIMILLPSWTNAEATQERLLSAGFDCIVEGGATFFERDEVRLTLAALRAFDEPTDAEAIVFVLRGLFGISNDDLAKHAAAGGLWNYTVPEQPDGPAAEALAFLFARYREKARRSLVALLDDLMEHTQAPAVWNLTPRGRAMLANLDKVRELIRQFECATSSPSEVIEQFDLLRRRGEEQDLPVADSDANAIRITTLFKAKGLEAPVVFLLHARRRPTPPMGIVDRDAGTVAFKVKDLMPPGYAALEKKEKAAQQEEMRRWMYVAATRARDQLVICHTEKAKLLALDLARGLSGVAEAEHDALVEIAEKVHVRVRDPAQLPDPGTESETFPGLDDQVDRLLDDPPTSEDVDGATRSRHCSTKVEAAAAAATRWRSVTQKVKPRRFTQGGGVGMLGGTVVHRVMEHLDLSRDKAALHAEIGPLLEAQAALAGLEEEKVRDCEEVLRGLLELDIIDRARAAPERWQEAPFAFRESDGTIITGTIDLCFPVDESRRQWVVADWKSHLPPKGSPEWLAYQRQVGLYAKALIETMVGHDIEVVDRVIAGPHPKLQPDAWELALLEVRDELRDELSALQDLGVPPPTVGPEIEGVEVELYWDATEIVVVIDPSEGETGALGRGGCTVVEVRTDESDWVGVVTARLRAALDLRAVER